MILNQDDARLFYKLNPSLLLFTNRRLNIIPEIDSLSAFMSADMPAKKKIRDQVYEVPELIDNFIKENPFNFSAEEIAILASWKNFIKGSFIIIKHYKKYSVFLENGEAGKAYGVLGLTEPISNVVPQSPAYVEAVLLPFKNQIIYDGMIAPYSISFGSSYRLSFQDSFDLAKATYGIIESFPIKKLSESEVRQNLLKYYLKDMEFYQDDINQLIEKDEHLKELFYHEIGRKNSRFFKKTLQQYDISDCWFAMLGDVIIASGKTREEAEASACKIVSKQQENLLFYFQIE
ncbi:hypothetical protein L0Z72_14115 [candidate division KSB1 bacterium]|nr:hypothetical protein [candidate division KSB1 bacterium]